MASIKTEHQQQQHKEMIRFDNSCKKTNQQTFIENLCTLNAGHLNINKMFSALRSSQSHRGDSQVDGQLRSRNRNKTDDRVTVIDWRHGGQNT